MLQRFTLMRYVQTLLLAATLVAWLAPLRAQEPDAAAKAVTLVGDVSYLKDGQGSYKWALNPGQTVRQKWIIKTGHDGYAKFQVSDGSTFEVFPDSEVTFREDPGNWTHLLNVWIGHIKVIIQHLPGVANPNNVTTPTAVISVRGTIFEVIVEDLEGTTFISLDEGLVQVHHRLQPGPERFLNPGESVRVFPNQALGRVLDKGNFLRNAMKVAEDAIYQVVYRRGVPGGGPSGASPAPSSGAQGDKGKNGGSGGSGTAPVPPGTAPVPPGAAPPPPAGPGGGD